MSRLRKTAAICFSKETGHLSVNSICCMRGHESGSRRYGRRWMSVAGVACCSWYIRRNELTFPAAMSDRPSWYQRWNSLKENFMARSRHFEQKCKHNNVLVKQREVYSLTSACANCPQNSLAPLLDSIFLAWNGCQSPLTTHSAHNNMIDMCVDESGMAERAAHSHVVSHTEVNKTEKNVYSDEIKWARQSPMGMTQWIVGIFVNDIMQRRSPGKSKASLLLP